MRTPSSRPAVVNASRARSSCAPREGGGHLRADARLALRHHGEREPDDVDAELQQPVRHAAGERGVAEHHGNDRVLARLQVEARLLEAGAEVARVVEQLLAQLGRVLRADPARAGSRAATTGGMLFENRYGRERCRSQSMTRLARGDEAAAAAAERLAERAGDDVDAIRHAAVLGRAAAARRP